jgi:hypothetical protein
MVAAREKLRAAERLYERDLLVARKKARGYPVEK